MKPIRTINGLLTAILAFTFQAGTVHAATSTSYWLEGDTVENAATGLRSEHYSGQLSVEETMAVLRSNAYSLLPNKEAGGRSYAPDSSSSSSSSSESSSTSGGATSSTSAASHGGGRDMSSSSSASLDSSSSSASLDSSSSSSLSFAPWMNPSDRLDAGFAGFEPSVTAPKPLRSLHPAASRTVATEVGDDAQGARVSRAHRMNVWVASQYDYAGASLVVLRAKVASVLATVSAGLIALAWYFTRNPLVVRRLSSFGSGGSKRRKKTKAGPMRRTLLTLLFVAGVALAFAAAQRTSAANIPLTHAYNGRLLTASGTAVTTAVNIRLSYWSSADHIGTDETSGGAINTGAASYLSWNEVHTVTPDSNGYFSVEMGSVSSLPGYSSFPAGVTVYLQTEVKAATDPDTSYEVLDPAAANSTIDRTAVLSVPYAAAAGTLDRHSVGTGSGAIPFLLSGGLLPVSTIPDETNFDSFTLDADGGASSSIALTFGGILGKKLSFDIPNGRFEFNDDLKVTGDLTVTGTINGTTLSAIAVTPLAVTRSSGLTVAVASGSYRIGGTMHAYVGGTAGLSDGTTNYVFFTSAGLTVNTSGFPTDSAVIPLARVVTSGGAVLNIADARVLQSDDREQADITALHPDYEGAVFQADGTDNVGQLGVSHDAINLKNFYLWTSSRPTLQDYDVLVRTALPVDFNGWNDGITLQYRSTSASASDNSLTVQVYDTNGSPVSLSGSAVNLAGTSWAATHLEFSGTPTWTKGQEFLVRLKFSAKDDYQMQAGDLKFSYHRLSAP